MFLENIFTGGGASSYVFFKAVLAGDMQFVWILLVRLPEILEETPTNVAAKVFLEALKKDDLDIVKLLLSKKESFFSVMKVARLLCTLIENGVFPVNNILYFLSVTSRDELSKIFAHYAELGGKKSCIYWHII